jgi:hypothetical protein
MMAVYAPPQRITNRESAIMSPRARLFQALLRDGAVVLRDAPTSHVSVSTDVIGVLRAAYTDYGADIAGPPLMFEEATALAAAGVVEHACRALVSQALPADELQTRVQMPAPPRTAAEHFSGDLLLRYLPQVLRRARARDAADPLVQMLERTLRQWPLSGVLADIQDGPETGLDFGGHPGLMLLYAERLAGHEKPAWFPGGECAAYVELVWTQLGKTAPYSGSARK